MAIRQWLSKSSRDIDIELARITISVTHERFSAFCSKSDQFVSDISRGDVAYNLHYNGQQLACVQPAKLVETLVKSVCESVYKSFF